MGQGFWVAFPRRHWLSLPLWKTQWRLSPGGTGYPCRCGARGGGLAFGCLSPLPLALFLPPIPPTPFPGGEGGDQSYFMQGASPLASPRLSPGGTYRTSQAGARSGALPLARRGAFRYPAGAWQLRRGTGKQCRQPRRGGTGGDGTIRRTRRRRLRWSSPPGQVEQVPSGASPLRAPQQQGEAATPGASPQKSHRFVRFRIFCPCSDRQTAPGQRTPPAGQQSQARSE